VTTTVSRDEDPMSVAHALGLPEPERLLTLKEWKSSLEPGRQLLCTYRWYWGKDKPAPQGGTELCEFIEVRATQAIMKTPTTARSWMHYPRASELKATESGFEIYFPNEPKWGENRAGKLMSRYQWVQL
jgi:hypothetical protein